MLSKVISTDNIMFCEKLIDHSEKIIIITHVSPDGDAMGASVGLQSYLRSIDKQVNIISPNRYAKQLDWIADPAGVVNFEQSEPEVSLLFDEADLIFCLDFNQVSRAGALERFIRSSAAKKVMIDHHRDPEEEAFDLVISHPQISSTCELVFRLICRFGDYNEISQEGAEAIYTGMMTDTGNFTYNSNSPEIYFIISQLLALGVDKDAIYGKMFHTFTVDRLKLQGYALSQKMEVLSKVNAAVIALSQKETEDYNYQKGDLEGVVNMPLSIEDVDVSVLIREEDGQVRMSFRSQGDVAVNILANALFGGGGHVNAAGAESNLPLVKVVSLVKKALKTRNGNQFELHLMA